MAYRPFQILQRPVCNVHFICKTEAPETYFPTKKTTPNILLHTPITWTNANIFIYLDEKYSITPDLSLIQKIIICQPFGIMFL